MPGFQIDAYPVLESVFHGFQGETTGQNRRAGMLQAGRPFNHHASVTLSSGFPKGAFLD
jgi:hypothetical protein